MGGSKISLELWMLLLLLAVATAAATSLALRPGCNDTCGGVSIPYPFGMGTNCSLPGFDITCDFTTNPPKPFISTGNIEIVNISLIQGEMRIKKAIAYNCFNQTDIPNETYRAAITLDTGGPYRLSDTHNKFTAVGCYTAAFIVGKPNNFTTGCMAFCDSPKDGTDGSCTGRGCCQTSIEKDLNYYKVDWGFSNNEMWESVPCSYAMLVDEKWYNFRRSDLSGYKDFYNKNNGKVQLVLDWAVRDLTCPEAKERTDYACRSSSECYNSTNGLGYICKCSQGYEGNPYLLNGCTDIDECAQPERYPCNGKCKNTQGGHYCTKQTDKFPLVAKIVIGIIPMIGLLIKLAIWIQKRKYIKEKNECRKRRNGESKIKAENVFTEEELRKATNNFNKKSILDKEGRGKVYKGELADNRKVAIKKYKAVDKNQNEEFVNEMETLLEINHRSVVKLLGCCLEVRVPMLVYEFIPNGTLFDLLHVKKETIHLHVRLEIAFDSADALAYLHSPAAHSIIHGAVKSSNILLDANNKAKVSNFGASSLLVLDDDQFAELVQGEGTSGYLDPECISTRQLTHKSDVYNFGVVLLELITRKETKSLVSSFVLAMKQNKLHEILDDLIVEEGPMDLLQEVAELALHCVSLKREERPIMKEVKERLKRLTKFEYHPLTQNKPEEAESFLGDQDISSSDTTAYNSVGCGCVGIELF